MFPDIEKKIISFEDASILIKQYSQAGIPSILAQGVFDLFHQGHLEYLELAKKELFKIIRDEDEYKNHLELVKKEVSKFFLQDHLEYLDYLVLAKIIEKYTGILVVGVETDEAARLNKGPNRPYNPQDDRMHILAALEYVNYVFPYEDSIQYGQNPQKYTNRLSALAPAYLAISRWDPYLEDKQTQAIAAGIKCVIVQDTWVISTTNIAQRLGWE